MYLTIKDIAQKINVSEETVRRWIRDGKLSAEDMGGRLGYRITQAEFERFFQLRNGATHYVIENRRESGAVIGSTLGLAAGLIGGPVGSVIGATVGGFLGGIVGETFASLTSSNKVEQQQVLEENWSKLEARKYEIEQIKIELNAKIKSLDAELSTIERLLGQINLSSSQKD